MPGMVLVSVLLITLVAGAICLLIVRRCFWIVIVSGNSMYPAFKEGDHVIVMRYLPKRWLRRGQVVIAENLPHGPEGLGKYAGMASPEFGKIRHKRSRSTKPLIKRLIGLPEETVTVSGRQPILRTRNLPPPDDVGDYIWHVPADHCFLKGDSIGIDSCVWGPIPLRYISGVVVCKLTKSAVDKSSRRTARS